MAGLIEHRRTDDGRIATVLVEGAVPAVPPHAHLSVVIGLVEAGTRRLTIAGVGHDLVPGEGMVIPADVPHAWAPSGLGRHRIIILDPSRIAVPVWIPTVIRDAAWASVVRALHDTVTAGGDDSHALAEALVRLTDRLADHPTAERVSPTLRSVRLARREATRHLDSRLDLADLGRAVGLSPFYLHRLYRRAWGLTPAEHRLEARLRLARDLILSGMRIAEVAAATGFADQSHLTRAFRRLMGVPPGLWIRQMRRTRKP